MMTYYLRNEQGFPESCVAIEAREQGVIYAVSSWNAKIDKNNYERSRSRTVALGRLSAGTIVTRNGTLVGGALEPGPQVLRRVLKHIIEHKKFATRLREVAEMSLKRLEAKPMKVQARN